MPNENCIDYAAIYESLAQLMQGEVPKDLNLATSRKILEIIKKLYTEINDPATRESLRKNTANLDVYSPPLAVSRQDLGWEEMHLLQGTNPIHFPEFMFRSKGDQSESSEKVQQQNCRSFSDQMRTSCIHEKGV